MNLHGKELILGVTGSIAAYKAVYLLRELDRLGAGVSVVATAHALEFVAPLTWRTLSGRPRLAIAGFVAGGRAAADAIERRSFDVLGGAPRPRRRDLLRRLLMALR